MPTKEELEIEIDALQNKVRLMEIERALFADKVRDVAMKCFNEVENSGITHKEIDA